MKSDPPPRANHTLEQFGSQEAQEDGATGGGEGRLVARACEGFPSMTEVVESKLDVMEEGPSPSLWGGFPGTEPYANVGEPDLHPPPGIGVRKTAYRGWVFEYDLPELGAYYFHRDGEPFPCGDCETARREERRKAARRNAWAGWVACVRCRTPFMPVRADNIYCSKGCRVRGARLGRERIDELLADDSWMRRCQAPDCEESIIGMREGTRFHSTACRVRAHYRGGKE